MHINLYFSQLATRRGERGAIFVPRVQGARNHSQFLPRDLLEYMMTETEFDRAKEDRLMRIENKYIIAPSEIMEAFERNNGRECKGKRLHYVGLRSIENEIRALFRTADNQIKISLTEADVRTLTADPQAAVNSEGYRVRECELVEAIGHFKNTAQIENQPKAP